MEWQSRGLVSSSQVQKEELSEPQQPISCFPSQAYVDPTLPCGYTHNQLGPLVTEPTTDSMLVLRQSANIINSNVAYGGCNSPPPLIHAPSRESLCMYVCMHARVCMCRSEIKDEWSSL